MNKRIKDITGRRYGRLVVIEFVESINGKTRWKCKCDCGNEKIIWRCSLYPKCTISCGCAKSENSRKLLFRHGHTRTPEHNSYCNMMGRCYNKNSDDYKDYGGRGILVCERWHGENGFTNFLVDMGKKPSKKHSLGRIENNKNYSPENCRWESPKEQQNNKRSNIIISFQGESLTIAQWADKLNMDYFVLYRRIVTHKWSAEKALTRQVRKRVKK